MKSLRPENLHENIEEAIVTFSDTGEIITLTTRERSANHFFPRFKVGDDIIQLRLDWSALDSEGKPTLDADFFEHKTGKHRKLKGKRRNAHHTRSLPGDDRCYEWEFNGFSREYSVSIKWRAAISENLQATEYCSAEVLRGGDRNRD